MTRKPRIQSRVGEQTKQKLEQYAEANDISQSEAVRRLVQQGLDREREQRGEWVQSILIITGLLYLLTEAYTSVSGTLWYGFGAVLAVAIPLSLFQPWRS